MSKVNFNEFTWFAPRPKNQLAITIPNLYSLNLNPKLMEEMPAYITIGVNGGAALFERTSAFWLQTA